MNPAQLIKQDKKGGPYAILFRNAEGLEVEQIKEIFEKFGEVLSVKITGNQYGYRFVRYASLKEAQNAVERLKDHPIVKLVPHRIKTDHDQEEKTVNSSSHNFDSHSNNFDSKSNNFNSNSNHINSKNNDAYSDSSHFNSNNNDSMNGTTKKNRKYLKKMHNGLNKGNDENNVLEKSSKITEKNKNNKNSPFLTHINNESNQLMSDKTANIDTDEIPKLVSFSKQALTKKNIPVVKVFNAEEVIVANLHPEISAPYILYLFEQFEPLAISEIVNIPNTKMRYCHVYFKTINEALSVEQMFDQFDILGKKLIVLRKNQLIREAAS